MIKCLLCHKEFNRLSFHLKAKHSLSTFEYKKNFLDSETNSKETLEKMRLSKLGEKLTIKHRKNLSISHLGYVPTKEHRKNLSFGIRNGKFNSGRFKKGNIPFNKLLRIAKICPICNKDFEGPIRFGRKTCSNKCWRILAARNLIGKGSGVKKGNIPWNKNVTGYSLPQNSIFMKKYWEDEEKVKIMTKNRIKGQRIKPNKMEVRVNNLLQKYFPGEWKYNKYDLIIDKKIPDFININGKKCLIEFLGCYHHGCSICFPNSRIVDNFEQRKEMFKSFGFNTLAIWEHELKNEESVVKRIKEFV